MSLLHVLQNRALPSSHQRSCPVGRKPAYQVGKRRPNRFDSASALSCPTVRDARNGPEIDPATSSERGLVGTDVGPATEAVRPPSPVSGRVPVGSPPARSLGVGCRVYEAAARLHLHAASPGHRRKVRVRQLMGVGIGGGLQAGVLQPRVPSEDARLSVKCTGVAPPSQESGRGGHLRRLSTVTRSRWPGPPGTT
jgi:hypothetical protein